MENNKDILMVTGKIISTMEVNFRYVDDSNKTMIIKEGDIVEVSYVTSNKLKVYTGRVSRISLSETTARHIGACLDQIYTIELDCSVNFKAFTVSIPLPAIRELKIVEVIDPEFGRPQE